MHCEGMRYKVEYYFDTLATQKPLKMAYMTLQISQNDQVSNSKRVNHVRFDSIII